jgi:hypothetical protein
MCFRGSRSLESQSIRVKPKSVDVLHRVQRNALAAIINIDPGFVTCFQRACSF